MTVCAISGCHNASDQKNKSVNITYHSIPLDPVIAQRWVEQIRLSRKEPWWKPSKNTKICSTHFNDSDKYCTEGGLWRIRRGAVPSQYMNFFTETAEDGTRQNVCHQFLYIEAQAVAAGMDNETKLNSPAISHFSIVDSPTETLLRRQLKKRILRQQKMAKKIKALQQNARRLKKRNAFLQYVVANLRRQRLRYMKNEMSKNNATETFDSTNKKD